MPISITQAERGLLSATLCLFVLEKAGMQGEGALLFVWVFFFHVLLALAAEYPMRNRRVIAAWDECHQIPICRGHGMALHSYSWRVHHCHTLIYLSQ